MQVNGAREFSGTECAQREHGLGGVLKAGLGQLGLFRAERCAIELLVSLPQRFPGLAVLQGERANFNFQGDIGFYHFIQESAARRVTIAAWPLPFRACGTTSTSCRRPWKSSRVC
jgi:hypothetical protein